MNEVNSYYGLTCQSCQIYLSTGEVDKTKTHLNIISTKIFFLETNNLYFGELKYVWIIHGKVIGLENK